MSQRPTTEDIFRGNGQSEKSAGQLIKEVTEDLSTLVRKEIELAKQEVGESISAKVKGAAIIGIAGFIGMFALMFALIAIRDGVADAIWTWGSWMWAADLVTMGILLVIGLMAALVAKKKLTAPFKTELTKKTIKDDVEWAKTLGKQ
jgi:uncharacterized membrane protein YqjE